MPTVCESPGQEVLNTDGIGAERDRNGAGAVEFQWMHSARDSMKTLKRKSSGIFA